jgi:hypothetical protein
MGKASEPQAVDPEIMASLLATALLVPSKSGGYIARPAKPAEKRRMTDHRPERPSGEAATPGFNEAESPLSWLRSRKSPSGRAIINDEQFLAGERLRADYERSRLERRTTASWDPAHTAGGHAGNRAADLTDSMIAARQRLHAALDAVGPELAGILVQICCLSAGMEQAERLLDMPQRAGKAVLVLALTSLARHYGYLKSQKGSERCGAIGHWAVSGFRPAIPPQEAT